ncbi:Rab family GTPase [Nannocystaceae bacterium ST9]
MFSESITVAAAAIEHNRAIRDLAVRLWKRISQGQVRVVVFGAGGSGKSTLGKFLAGDEIGSDYRESHHLESYALDSTTPCTILVPPGQEGLRPKTWSDLQRHIASGRSTTALHVVSWGLDEVQPVRYVDRAEYRAGMTVDEFVSAYSEAQRNAELRVIEDLATHLGNAPHHLSLVTVVVKQDLWWASRNAVRAHYSSGKYAEHVGTLRNHLGDQNFTHKLWSASLVRRNLRDGEHTMLVPVAEGYDEPLGNWHAKRLVELIQAEVDHAGE